MHQSQVPASPDIRLGFALLTVFGGVCVLLYLAPGCGELQRTAERRAGPLVERIAGWSARHKKTAAPPINIDRPLGRHAPIRRERIMKHLYVTPDRLREGFQAGHDLPRPRPVPDVPAEPDPHVSRPNSAPAYYQGRPASLWINLMRPRRGRPGRDGARQSGPAEAFARARMPMPPRGSREPHEP
jgi:hypothetical protein